MFDIFLNSFVMKDLISVQCRIVSVESHFLTGSKIKRTPLTTDSGGLSTPAEIIHMFCKTFCLGIVVYGSADGTCDLQ